MKRLPWMMLCVSLLAFAKDLPRARLKDPDYLPPLARQLLRSRMERHGEDMIRLVIAVTLLQKDSAKSLATDIANEPKLTQPIAGGEGDLNAALPQQFFRLQDELRSRASSVADAATKPDNAALAQALGRLTETCVACHSVYLHRSDDSSPVKKEPKL